MNEVEYRYCRENGKKRKFDRTKYGAIKFWELGRCIDDRACPFSQDVKNNLRFLIGLRNEIEHQMTLSLDRHISAKFQANCINYNACIKKYFGEEYGVDRHISVALQFSHISPKQVEALSAEPELPQNITAYIRDFESKLPESEFQSPCYSYRVMYVAKLVSHKGQVDEVVEFVKGGSELAKGINKVYVKEMKLTDRYPLSYQTLWEGFRSKHPNYKQTVFNKLLGKIKGRPEYSAYNFRTKSHEESYDKTREIPVGTPCIYNTNAMAFLDQELIKNI
jgi:hypothetical protein